MDNLTSTAMEKGNPKATRESDNVIVPKSSANKPVEKTTAAELKEGRALTKGNPSQPTNRRTQSRERLQQAQTRIRRAVKHLQKEEQMTNLMHHIYEENHLLSSYWEQKRTAAPGVDSETWTSYGKELD